MDVLLVFNLYVDFTLLTITARLTHSRLPTGRALAGAVLGALSALMLLLPPLPLPVSILSRLLTAVLMCTAAFGFGNFRVFAWKLLCFFFASFALAGIFLALSFTGRVRVLQGNSCWYLDVSLLHLILFTIAAYLLLTAAQRLYERHHAVKEGYRVQIRYGRCTVRMQGLADTGNSLTDFLTGKPVIICDKKELGNMVPEDLTKPVRGFRLLPYETVSGAGMLAVFRPDEVVIYEEGSGKYRKVDALVGAGECENKQAIFNPRLL